MDTKCILCDVMRSLCVWCKGHKNGYYIIMYNMEKHKMHTIWIVVRKMWSTYYILYWNGGLIDDTTILSFYIKQL